MNVVLSLQAQKDFDRLPAVIKERMRLLFRRLATWPQVSGVKALTANLAGLYRLRTGDNRLLFRAGGQTIIVERIAHRKDVYED